LSAELFRPEGVIAVSAKRTKGASKITPSRGRADLKRVRDMTEAQIARTSPPELANLPEDFWSDAEIVTAPKEAISLRVDQDVLSWFRESGPRYQSRINAVLRSYVRSMKRHPAKSGSKTKSKSRRGAP
jgi:uncharacterized protein (DUF4415 family)